TGTGASTYTWNPGALTGSSVIVTPTITTTYSVTGANGAGCTNTKTITITVNPLPVLSISSTATNICSGSSATLTGSGASSYTWNPGGATTSTTGVSPATTTSYTLLGSSVAGCTNTILFTLSVTPMPTVTAVANPTSICLGNSSTLTASGATIYTWNPGPFAGSSVVVTPTASTVYTVTGANGICSTTKTVSVNVNPVPALTALATSPTICAGASSSLVATGGVSYTWSPGALTGSNVVVSPTLTTNYTVTGSNLFGCTNTQTVSITVNPSPSLTITATSTTLCSGKSATLTGSGASTYTWNPGGTFTPTLVVTPPVTSTYTLIGSSVAGCTAVKTITISVTPTPTVSASASSTVLCSGNSTTLTASGAPSYTWNPGAITGTTAIVTPTGTTAYTLTGANGACTATAAISVSVNPSPTITVISNPTVLCSGNSATLTASGASSYTWLPMAVTGSTVAVTPSVTTTYTVTGINAAGCLSTVLFTQSVTPTPSVSVSASASVICTGSSSTLTATGATSYTWLPGAFTGSVIVVSPTITTSYTVTGVNGSCSNTTIKTITVNALPTVTASASPTIVCSGSSLTLVAGGASTYTWLPLGTSGSTVTATPTINTTYTVTGTNANGCTNQAVVTVSVNNAPSVIAAVSPTSICTGGTGTLIANGAITYTWSPGNLNGSIVNVSPSVTTVYTVTGSDPIGCSATQTVQLVVQPNPTVTIVSSFTALCLGNSATMAGNGAVSYTWIPGASTNSVIMVTPTITTIYTLTGSNGSCGTGTTSITIIVNSPPTATASNSGTISCTTPSVNLLGSSSATNVGYSWSGPGGFTTSAQSPTGIAIPGNYTLTVTDLSSGCNSTATTAVLTDTSVPSLTATASGSVSCANPTATVLATTSSTNAAFSWTGPGSFTNTSASFTTATGGTYTLTVTDLTSSCPASTIVIVSSNTAVPITATIVPATCSGTVANNNAAILAGGFVAGNKYDFVIGSTYTGSATFATALLIPGSGILTNTLANPSLITPYTVRFFANNGCYKDTTLFLVPTSCISNTVFGVAKAVSTPTLKTNGTYDVNYFVVIKNTGSQQLNNIALTENLSQTFPLPTTYSIVSAPVVTSLNSSISINPAFDGSVQTVMTNATLSALAPGKTDTIKFTVNLTHNGNFGPFNNTVLGFASPAAGVVLGDSSNTGYNPDPDLDGNPTNNNIPTILNLTPNLFFGLTKEGSVSTKLVDDTWDITYTITVHNLGNDTLKNIIIKDSLFNNTIKQPATYTIKSGPTTTGSLVANSAFNGNTNINLLNASLSKLSPGSVNSIIFTINVVPDTVTIFKNSAFGRAVNTTSIVVRDTSNAGSNPDSNANGVWNEPADNVPTILTIPNSSLFIPAGFSPDGDGKNDLFVIKGLNGSTDNTFTVYNRWGNKVYSKNNYDNTWNGAPNVSGTMGSERLPQGTYYYILEFKGSDLKPMNGFIVIQY
ncbi:MAG: gliding motility-associated C-terminal domain-containing protein, partial [Bacteroidetes bacterium]|nr:gliding motility-associated C-terminal domain-containing protein [Bacteroidota bacterium]